MSHRGLEWMDDALCAVTVEQASECRGPNAGTTETPDAATWTPCRLGGASTESEDE